MGLLSVEKDLKITGPFEFCFFGEFSGCLGTFPQSACRTPNPYPSIPFLLIEMKIINVKLI